jgi:hypothetical protein
MKRTRQANQLPDFDWSAGTSPFAWIVRTAPMVREARQAIAGQERREIDYAKQEESRPADRTQAG